MGIVGPVLPECPYFAAKRGSWEHFLSVYDPAVAPFFADDEGRTVLFAALANPDPELRERIANRLLDDGADPSIAAEGGWLTVLHVLLTQPHLDPASTTRLLRRLIAGGADINQADRAGRVPLWMCWTLTMDESDIAPMFQLLLSRTDLDLERPAVCAQTLRQQILASRDPRRQVLRRLLVERVKRRQTA
ncbi:MAG: hypothetical protein ACK5H2_08760 [Beutenbergiaceae bacterium]